jgi:hypothetical protein
VWGGGREWKKKIVVTIVYPEIRRDAFASNEFSITDFHSGELGKFL